MSRNTNQNPYAATGPCPRCGSEMMARAAVSRRDNETSICPDCGLDEALVDARVRRTPERKLKPTWPWQKG